MSVLGILGTRYLIFRGQLKEFVKEGKRKLGTIPNWSNPTESSQ